MLSIHRKIEKEKKRKEGLERHLTSLLFALLSFPFQGDVGCGKTIVAFLACMEVIGSGFQVSKGFVVILLYCMLWINDSYHSKKKKVCYYLISVILMNMMLVVFHGKVKIPGNAPFCNCMGYLERKMMRILMGRNDWCMMYLRWLRGVGLIVIKLKAFLIVIKLKAFSRVKVGA